MLVLDVKLLTKYNPTEMDLWPLVHYLVLSNSIPANPAILFQVK